MLLESEPQAARRRRLGADSAGRRAASSSIALTGQGAATTRRRRPRPSAKVDRDAAHGEGRSATPPRPERRAARPPPAPRRRRSDATSPRKPVAEPSSVACAAEGCADARAAKAEPRATPPACRLPRPRRRRPRRRPPPRSADGDGFSVQLAAFADDKGANSLANKLKKSGFRRVHRAASTTSRGTLWRVRVGPYRDARRRRRGARRS